MAKWARIDNGSVVEVTTIDPDGRHHPELVWVSCGDEIDETYDYDGSSFVPGEVVDEPAVPLIPEAYRGLGFSQEDIDACEAGTKTIEQVQAEMAE